jgi:hypothetical protein
MCKKDAPSLFSITNSIFFRSLTTPVRRHRRLIYDILASFGLRASNNEIFGSVQTITLLSSKDGTWDRNSGEFS